MAAAAGRQSGGLRNQVDQQVIAVRPDRSDRKALPKGQKRINIVHKNAGLWMCLFVLTSSLKLAFLFLSFPGFREEPKIWGKPSMDGRLLLGEYATAFSLRTR